jgi:hypothetical protein
MKLIFLDIDGVICTSAPGRKTILPSRSCIEILNQITDATGAKIVLASGRRFNPGIEATLAEWGVRGEVLGRTPIVGSGLGGNRAKEIEAWLAECTEPVEAIAILDDGPIEGELRRNVVPTEWSIGLTRAKADEVINRLH